MKPVLTMHTHVTNLSDAVATVELFVERGEGAYVCISNVHMCMETYDDIEFRSIVNNADLVIPDGKPISWAQKLLGAKGAEQVRGQDIMNELCSISGEKSLNIGLYGGSSESVLDDVVNTLKCQFPDIRITYRYSPPFRSLSENEDNGIIHNINEAQVNVLFVGIGCPKQERWMAEHKDSLNCVMLGVGAAYDFIAGSKNHAPRWMQRIGLEWLFRLASEPRRLWRRYLKQNPRFVYYFLQQWLFNKEFK